MKGKQLRKAVLLGMAMSMAIWTTGMAAEAIVADGVTLEPIITATGDYSIESEGNGITASNGGSVTIETTNGKNTINAGLSGIKANHENSVVSVTGASNEIYVNDDIGSTIYGISANENATVNISSTDGDFVIQGDTPGTHAYGIVVGNENISSGNVNVSAVGNIQIDMITGAPNATSGNVYGAYAKGDGSIELNSGANIIVSTKSHVVEQMSGGNNTAGLESEEGGKLEAIAGGFVDVQTIDTASTNYGIAANGKASSISVTAKGQNEEGNGINVYSNGKLSHAVYAQNGTTDITAENGGISVIADGAEATDAITSTASDTASYVKMTAKGNIFLSAYNDSDVYANTSYAAGVFANSYGPAAETTLSGQDITIKAKSENNAAYAVYGYASGDGASNDINISGNDITVTAESGSNVVYGVYGYGKGNGASNDINISGNNIQVTANGGASLSNYGVLAANSNVDITAQGSTTVSSNGYGLYAWDSTGIDFQINVTSVGNNSIYGGKMGVVADGAWADAQMISTGGDNIVQAGTIDEQGFGSGIAVKALSGAQLTFKAENGWNAHLGAIDIRNDGTNVTLDGVVNAVYSAAKIDKAGNLDDDDKFKDKTVISALYAEGDAAITATGDWNIFRTTADPTNKNQLERVLWAYDGADITVDGGVYISTDSYSISPNSADIAIAAGTATDLTYGEVTTSVADEDRAHVNLTYGAGSSITGDILAAYAGTVNIDAKEGSNAGISVTGNILAGNNGVLNIDLGKGGYLEGRADDYGDAGLGTTGEDNIDQGHATHEFFNPAFSSTIFKGGEVNLTMGEGSRWNVTGQSWVTRINTESAAKSDSVFSAADPVEAMKHNMATIDLTAADPEFNMNAHALTVYEMKGDAVFNVSLDANRDISDMLYMKNADGDYIINVVKAVTIDDMYANGFDGLRFATVGEGSNVSFRAVTVGDGVFNVEYEVGTDAYANNDENHAYNGGESVSQDKPGSDLVDGLFESTQEPGAAETQVAGKRMRMAAMAMPAAANDGIMLLDDAAAADDTATAAGGSVDETTNFKLIGRKDESTSNAGKTIIAMSKVNYSNAVYMDRLNKRMGEARYIDGDEGLWVRMRHDRIGKSDAFRSKNTMFELGYDRKVGDREDGEHRQGVVFDYMRGTADYHNVAGEGDVRRGGVWFYDTWLGNKGHYTDYVLKFGRLSNDFDIYSELGEKITGDYSNFVYSASAEYGRKKSLGGDWYIEPQAQLQYAHVTDADYTTSQGTSVQLDAIDSLIGRVGFRLGKDVSDTSTFYIKADVLHEFLGDQDISAFDDTGRLDTTYENEGTWYDVGLGFSHQFSKGTYMFLDVEKTFGNNNEDTYQFNVGMNWKV